MVNFFKQSHIGICQGRLISSPNGELQWFPTNLWPNEFKIAENIGLSHIELLAERKHNKENPLWTKEGKTNLINCAKRHKINLYSACLDYIISHPISEEYPGFDDTIKYTKNFINSCSELGIEIIILPFLEASELNSASKTATIKFLEEIKPLVKKRNILVSIESIADPKILIQTLSKVDDKIFGCVYDTGNRASIVNDQEEEINKLSKYINHVHLKDKSLDNKNVVIGSGIVDFKKIFKGLKKINYKKAFSFETNRGHDPKKTAQHNINFIKFFMEESSHYD
tara:strand:+ start:746 stop:1594 length:849 start_codon:yes stop_codon:yes gene_type:complete